MANETEVHRSEELEEKLQQFGEKIIELAKKVPKNTITIPILDQLISRAGTSIGANYMEANGASSKKRFPKQNSYLQKRSERNNALVKNVGKSI